MRKLISLLSKWWRMGEATTLKEGIVKKENIGHLSQTSGSVVREASTNETVETNNTHQSLTEKHLHEPVSTLSGWEALIERQIQLGRRKGSFDNLPGRGKPLPEPVLAPPGVDNLEFQLNKILASQGYVPPWVALRAEIFADIHKLQDAPDEHKKELLMQLRKRISTFNVSAPDGWPRIPQV